MTLSAVAWAQPGYGGGRPGYYSQQPSTTPGGFWDRGGGIIWGIGLGVGNMTAGSGPIECVNCSYDPVAWEVEFHVGGMVSPRLAILGEFQGNVQTLEVVAGGEGTKSLAQIGLMLAAQYWITPQLWVKGGLGFAHLAYNYDDAYQSQDEPIDDGAIVLGGIGYEILSGRNFAVDLQGRYIVGSYDGINDSVSSATIGFGINWY
ncbi:MAG: hypothetical protein R3B48_27630 [Kofleriaceae bacterium]